MAALPQIEPTPSPSEIGVAIDPPRSLLALAPPGRIVELSGRARTSLAARVLAEVQAAGDPVAWVTFRGAGLFPPDLRAAGLDLDALVVVHVPDDERAGPKAAELLLRTGAFGAVVLDVEAPSSFATPKATPASAHGVRSLGASSKIVGSQRVTAWQGRLLGILRSHDARLLLLTGGSEPARESPSLSPSLSPSMGPLVGVRIVLGRELCNGQLVITSHVVKDKSGLLSGREPEPEVYRGPAGGTPIAPEPMAREAQVHRLRRVSA